MGKDILRRSDVAQFASVSTGYSPPQATGDATDFTLVPLTPMRRIIAERMRAGSSVPTFTAEIEVDMTGCIQLRSELNEHSKGTRFGYHDIIAKCAAIAVENYPLVNASFTDQGIRVFQSVNIGIAVSLEQGLVVPVVCDVRRMDIASLAKANAANIAQVRTGKFDPKLLQNGTLTIEPRHVSHHALHSHPQSSAVVHPGRKLHSIARGLGGRSAPRAAHRSHHRDLRSPCRRWKIRSRVLDAPERTARTAHLTFCSLNEYASAMAAPYHDPSLPQRSLKRGGQGQPSAICPQIQRKVRR